MFRTLPKQADAVAAREARQARQLEALRAELANVRGSGHSTDALAALHDEALQEVRRTTAHASMPVGPAAHASAPSRKLCYGIHPH